MTAPVRIGLLGFAGLGSQDHQSSMYAPALRSRDDIVIRAVAAIDPAEHERARAAAADLGVGVVDSAEALLARDDVEAVVVCAPASSRVEVISAALAAGRHVLADKPLALTAAEVRAIDSAATQSGAVLAVAQHLRHLPMLAPTVAALRGGRIGLPWSVHSDFIVAGGDPIPDDELVNLGMYPIDLTNVLLGQEPLLVNAFRASASASAGTDGSTGALGTGEAFVVNVDYANAVTATAVIARTPVLAGATPSAPLVHRTRVAGTLGTLSVDFTMPVVTSQAVTATRTSWVGESTVAVSITDFITAIRTGRPVACGAADALLSARILDAATQSLTSGQPVSIEKRESQR